MKPPRSTASSPSMLEKAEQAKKARERLELDDMRWLMEQPQGRRFLFRLLQRGRIFSPMYVPGAEIYRNAAKHDFCLLYLSQVLTVNPAALQVMQAEANTKEIVDE